MININSLNISFSDKILFDSASAIVNPYEKVGLLGANGSGKSSLLKIISDPSSIFHSGSVERTGKISIGYLPQEINVESDTPLLAFVKQAFHKIQDLEDEISRSVKLMENRQLSEAEQLKSAERLSGSVEQMKNIGGYKSDTTASLILQGLGFSDKDFDSPLRNLSGGWRVKAYLARILAGDYDLLLLDEPTNYLDLESIIWLEKKLAGSKQAMIIVSHDTVFLDKIINSTISVERKKLVKFSGNYEEYMEFKIKKARESEKERSKQQKAIKETKALADKFRYKASKAGLVQTRLRKLEKMREIEAADSDPKRLNFKFAQGLRSGKEILKLNRVSFSYAENVDIIKDADLTIYRGDKIALLGKNGSGKSTLAKLLYGSLKATDGEIIHPDRTICGYFAQHSMENLNPVNSLQEELSLAAAPEYKNKIKEILGLFQFSGESQNKKIEVLSGGEKSRLALAKLFSSPANFIILDEPSNHLDIYSKPALINAINNYSGSCVIISHDQSLLHATADKIMMINNGQLGLFSGNYEEYMSKLENEIQVELASTPIKINENNSKSKRERSQQKEMEKNFRKLERSISEIEEKIHDFEKQIEEFKQDQLKPEIYLNHKLSKETQIGLEKAQEELVILVEKWEILLTKKESMLSGDD